MFNVTADEVALLNDVDLRELVALLCEAELTKRGLSPVAVTWGGSQTAPDGGLDVKVSLPANTVIEGFIPRAVTGLQVKKPDMSSAAIKKEMRPGDIIRPVIQSLADEGGAYIIVSSQGSTADRALTDRQNALRDALHDVNNSDHLHTEFYDRTRLATWVRCHPGLIIWVKERVGRAINGWRPYGSWTGFIGEYLPDDKLRVRFGGSAAESEQSVAAAIGRLRDELRSPRKIVRLVGLSGVGKTRFVQALFERGIGSGALEQSLAVYTNLGDNPNPQPVGMACDLIAKGMRAIVVVDNCPSDLHARLTEVCRRDDSNVSIITIEYDIRDDQPEGTKIVSIDAASTELVEKLLLLRHAGLSRVDAGTIANFSGGNARIALAIAGTLGQAESIAELSDEELFQRLFHQRH